VKFTHTAMVAAPKDKVWARLMDIPAAARCVPGVASVRPNGKDRYQGTLAVQIGPVRLVLDGDFAVTARDEAAGTASIRADAKDSRVGGAIRATLDLALAEKEASETQLRIGTDLTVMGRLGEFGQASIKRKADQLIQDFAECLARQVTMR
jgi:carbon monoxide dehydrogenase subunit G